MLVGPAVTSPVALTPSLTSFIFCSAAEATAAVAVEMMPPAVSLAASQPVTVSAAAVTVRPRASVGMRLIDRPQNVLSGP